MPPKRSLLTSLDESLKRQKPFQLNNNKILKLNNDLSTTYYNHYDFTIDCLEDFIALDDFYNSKFFDKSKTTNIPFFLIHKVRKPIEKLLKMIGMNDVKKQLLLLIVFYIQKFDMTNNTMLHSVIYGTSGVGKTTFIHILAEIYACLGILSSRKVTFMKRVDLIGQYLGHTAIKTKEAIESAKGGVLVIDEAYSLGDSEHRDSFSKECLDTLNQYLSEEKGSFICIIAGYKDDIDERFFNSNQGLRRRFPISFTLNGYTPTELKDIFCSIVKHNNWIIDPNDINIDLIKNNLNAFQFNGGDMENLFTKVKFIHSMRVFSAQKKHKKIISKEDFEKALNEIIPVKEPSCMLPMYM
jgi:replication-associated recombination protein RarA